MDWIAFAIFFGACCAAGATGAMFQPSEWYRALKQPSFTPPDWLFPVAWTTIYLLISFAAARVVGAPEVSPSMLGYGLGLWAIQIALNTLWTPVFFGLRRMRSALIIVAVLWLSVAATTATFFFIDGLAGAAFLPYLAWVTVASALNFAFMRLNPDHAT